MPFGIQPIHIVFIILVAILVFGASRLPEVGRGLGRAISEFRHGAKEMGEGFREEVNKPVETAQTGTPPAPAPPVAAAGGNFCIQCGAANLPEARFCSHCGAQLPGKA